ncbi:DM13 domain-containing protein [Methylophaga sp.]|uniref:DM13 domain-containing protein n=1 Tax=Methylophaga sp. TaxID=2024840 RepID=UPI003F6A25C6
MKTFVLLITHGLVLIIGFAAGIYLLPILTQPTAPDEEMIGKVASEALFTGQFQRDLKDSDALHYGDGTLYVSEKKISFSGSISPGPDYRLYLSPEFIETKADFLSKKAKMRQIGDVRTFENFLVNLPEDVNPADYNTAIVWCESFSIFITAGKYQ